MGQSWEVWVQLGREQAGGHGPRRGRPQGAKLRMPSPCVLRAVPWVLRAVPCGEMNRDLPVSARSFDPPGPMSAGMSCEVLVTFKPMVSPALGEGEAGAAGPQLLGSGLGPVGSRRPAAPLVPKHADLIPPGKPCPLGRGLCWGPPAVPPSGPGCERLSQSHTLLLGPQVEKDLEGHIWFLAQTGRFSVPLKCSIKKCSVCLAGRGALEGGAQRGHVGLCRTPLP